MLEILQFIFSSFWVFIGFCWMLLIIAALIGGIVEDLTATYRKEK